MIADLNELIRKESGTQGSWKLDSRHQLRYQSSSSAKSKEEYELEAALVSAEAGALIVSVTQKLEDGSVVTSLAKLSGTWRANAKNQFEFQVEGQVGKNDRLTFAGQWKIGENNEILYEYKAAKYQTRKTTKNTEPETQTLTFKGFWDLSLDSLFHSKGENMRLTYLIEGDTDSAFRFRGTFQTPSILAKKGEIRYQLGAEISGKLKTKRKRIFNPIVTLFGKWKLSDKFGLSFEMEYENGPREIRFGAEYSLTPDLEIIAKLTHPEAGPLGVELILTKDFGEAQGFLRLRKAIQENAIEAGITLPW